MGSKARLIAVDMIEWKSCLCRPQFMKLEFISTAWPWERHGCVWECKPIHPDKKIQFQFVKHQKLMMLNATRVGDDGNRIRCKSQKGACKGHPWVGNSVVGPKGVTRFRDPMGPLKMLVFHLLQLGIDMKKASAIKKANPSFLCAAPTDPAGGAIMPISWRDWIFCLTAWRINVVWQRCWNSSGVALAGTPNIVERLIFFVNCLEVILRVAYFSSSMTFFTLPLVMRVLSKQQRADFSHDP